MSVWKFNKNGEISNGEQTFSFTSLISAIESKNMVLKEIDAIKIGEFISNNDLVYMSQSDGKIYKAVLNLASPEQKQNLLGVYKIINNKSYIVYDGIVSNFSNNLIPGNYYYLSNVVGKSTTDKNYKKVMLGRAINTTDILLNIDGDIDIMLEAGYDTGIANEEYSEGNSFTDPSNTATLSFNKVAYDGTVPIVVMFAQAGNIVVKIDYAPTYDGKPLAVSVGNSTYIGVFTDNEDYANPIVLELAGSVVVNEPSISISTFIVDAGSKALSGTAVNAEQILISIRNNNTNTIAYTTTLVGSDSWTVPTLSLPTFDINVPYTVTVTADNGEGMTISTTATDTYVYNEVPLATVAASVFTTNPASKALSGTSSGAVTIGISIKHSNNTVVFTGTVTPGTNGAWAVTQTSLPTFEANVVYTATITAYNSENVQTIATKTGTHTTNAYNTSITHGTYAEGNSLTDPSELVTLSFNKVTYDPSVPIIVMFAQAGSVHPDDVIKIDFAPTYNGRAFSVVKNGVTYTGTFVENESYSTPTILTQG